MIKYPDSLLTKRARFVYWFFYQKYTFTTGKDKIGGFVLSMSNEVLLIIIALKFFGIADVSEHPFILVGTILLAMITIWILGRVYMNHNLDSMENLVTTERNPILDGMHKKIMRDE